jgi:hypothetical protein
LIHTAGLRRFGARFSPVLISCAALFFLSAKITAQTPAPADKPAAAKPDASVQAQMHNVIFRFTEGVAVHIKSVKGALLPTSGNEFPDFDDKNSFVLRIDAGEIAITPKDLGNVLNSYVFARPGSGLAGISVSTDKNHLKLRGRLRDKGNIPFETLGTLSLTPEGKVRLHTDRVKTLGVPVKGLMDTFGIGIAGLIKTGKVPGVEAQENDFILDLSTVLPPPHIQGKMVFIKIEGDDIVVLFGDSGNKNLPKLQNRNYMAFKGNRLRFGKLTMDDADITLLDMDPQDPMVFDLDHYIDQLAAGYTKISANFALRVYLKDFDKLNKPSAPAAAESKEKEKKN